MADRHPYTPGGPGGIAAAIAQLRKSFPKIVDADTLRKLSIAPKNESYIINILRFVGAIDASGNKTDEAASVFSKSDDDFKVGFEAMVKKAYSGLFELHGDDAWSLPHNKLMSYFRSTDQTTEIVGRNQASTFQVLASFSGHGEPASPASPKPPKTKVVKPPKPENGEQHQTLPIPEALGSTQPPRDFGLTVRVEVNLPPQADQETYDKIFRSIRENLFPNGK
ncbi:MAG TPA: DUF5343 domain-containing protein [Terriglobales bacterium]|nr:DUF5343 domain-containing protein [Terriglobales bacterium]